MQNRDTALYVMGIGAMLAFYKGLEVLLFRITSAPFPSSVHYYSGLGLVALFVIVQLTVGQAIKRVPQAFLALALCVLAMGVSFRLGNAIGRVFETGKYEWAVFANGFSTKGEISVLGSLAGGLLALLFAYVGFIGLFQVLFSRRPNAPFTGEKHLRGRGLISFDKAKQIAATKTQTAKRPPFFGMLHIPERAATTHFLFVGATGSGKTLSLRMLMESVLPVKDSVDTRALIYDAKQDMLSVLEGMNLGCPIYILNPFDKRCVAWDMARDITSPSSADQLATILIPEEKNSSSPYFSDAARALMSGAIISLMRSAPGAWEFRDVIYALKNAERLKKLLSRTKETEDLIPQYFSNERTANDVISTVATKIQRYQYIAAAWSQAKEKISLTKWAEENSILVLGNDEATRSALDAINRVIFKRVTELVLAQNESQTRRTWFFLDELRQAGKFDGLNSLLTMGRSKGACVAIGFQDIEGLSSVYGEKEAAEIAGLCANKAILRLDSPHTAKWAASVFGEREILEVRASSGTTSGENKGFGATSTTSSGESNSTSEQVSKRELILGSEFMDIPPTNFEYGLLGTYLIPEVGAYRARAGGDWLKNSLQPPSRIIPNFVRRDEQDEVLFPWNDDDFRRLGLPKEKESHAPSEKLELEESEPTGKIGISPSPSEGEENYEKMMKLFKGQKP